MIAAILAFIKGLFSKAENDIATISEQIGGYKTYDFSVAKSSSITLRIPGSCGFWVYTQAGIANTLSSIYFAIGSSTNANPLTYEVKGASNITISSSNGYITIANGSSANDASVLITRLFGTADVTEQD